MFKPIGPRLLVRRIESNDETEGGIKIPDTARDKSNEGVVVKVGDGQTTECCGLALGSQFEEGTRVVFGKYSGETIVIDGAELLIIDEEDVRGIIEEDTAVADTYLKTT